MSVSSTTRKTIFAGGQNTLTFSFRTLVSNPEYIKVKKTLTSTGVDTDLVYNTDYTVSILADGTGGTVTMTPSVSTLFTTTVYRDTGDLQSSDYNDYNQFPADTLENDLDRRTLISQERSDDVTRTLKFSVTSTVSSGTLPTPVDGSVLAWSGSTGAIINITLAALGAIVVDTDNTLAANSDTRVASQKAIKSYIATQSTLVTGQTLSLNIIFDGGGAVIPTGSTSFIDVFIDFNCTILQSTLFSTTSGSIAIDIWKASYSGIPTIGNSIVASAKPALSSAQVAQDTTLSGWTTTIPSNSTLRFVVSTSSLVTRVTHTLKLRKTSF